MIMNLHCPDVRCFPHSQPKGYHIDLEAPRLTDLEPPVQAVFHDGDELLVGEVAVPVYVKQLKHRVHEVVVQLLARAHQHCPLKLT